MKKTVLAGLPFAAVLASGATALSAQSGDGAEIPPLSAFNPIQRYNITYDKPRDIAEFYIRDFGINKLDADFVEVKHPTDRSKRIMLVTVDDIQDEAVRGAQWRLELQFSRGSWEAVEAGIRRKCQRGTNAGKWTRDVCP